MKAKLKALVLKSLELSVRSVVASGANRVWRISRNYQRYVWNKSTLANLGTGTVFHSHIVIYQPENVSIGSQSAISDFVHIWGGGGVFIGDNVLIASHVAITSVTHDTKADVFRNSVRFAPVVIQDNCWIGAGARLLPGITVGSGSIVGAGAVVTRDVPAGSIVTGIPARTRASRDAEDLEV